MDFILTFQLEETAKNMVEKITLTDRDYIILGFVFMIKKKYSI